MQLLFFVLAGVMFGMANVIPGVSGGTIAVVFGVYERLIGILSDLRHKVRQEWKFLITFGVGLVAGIVLFGKLMNYVLVHYPAYAQLFFVGVILGSLPMLLRETFLNGGRAKKPVFALKTILPLLIAFVIMIPMAINGNTEEAKAAQKAAAQLGSVNAGRILLMVVYGVIASSTMIIPGISGSFVMLLLGIYGSLIGAVAALVPIGPDTAGALVLLLPFAVGIVLGLIYCSRLIKYLLSHHPAATYSAILGFVLGSIWCVFPTEFAGLNLWIALGCVLLGLAVLWACGRIAPDPGKTGE